MLALALTLALTERDAVTDTATLREKDLDAVTLCVIDEVPVIAALMLRDRVTLAARDDVTVMDAVLLRVNVAERVTLAEFEVDWELEAPTERDCDSEALRERESVGDALMERESVPVALVERVRVAEVLRDREAVTDGVVVAVPD